MAVPIPHPFQWIPRDIGLRKGRFEIRDKT